MDDRCIDFKEGKNEFSKETFECGKDYAGCAYQVNGRCCYYIATIMQPRSKACYDPNDLRYYDED